MASVALTLLAVLQVGPAWVEDSVPDVLLDVEVRSVAVTPDGSTWFGVPDRGLAWFDGSQVRWVSPGDGFTPEGVSDLLVDRSGQLWAVGLGGYSVLGGSGWIGSPSTGPLTPRVVFTADEDPSTGAIWLSGTEGAARWLEGDWTVFDERAGLPHAVVHAAHTDMAGVTWFACRRGLARLGPSGLEILFPELNFRSIVESGDGELWFGTSDGVLNWNGLEWTHDLRGLTVYPRLVATDGSIWAGSASSGVYRYWRGSWHPVSLTARFLGAEVFDLDEALDGSIWIATSAGVIRLRSAEANG